MSKRVVLLAAAGVQALDVTGPASVFSAANDIHSGDPYYEIVVASPEGGLIQTVSGVALGSQPIADIAPNTVDMLLVAGHDRRGSEALIANQAAGSWVTAIAHTARRWGSVCSGAFPLAGWGLLQGKKATTHWSATDELAELFPDIEVDQDLIYVVDGNLWTSAGITAGIDMALAMVEEDLGPAVATEVARHLVVYLRRPGHQSQFSSSLQNQSTAASPYSALLTWAATHLGEDLSVNGLAERAGQSPRTFQRRFAEQVGQTPAAVIEDLRLDRAKTLIASDVPLQTVAEEIGYASASQLTSTFRRRLGVAPSVWKAMHCG